MFVSKYFCAISLLLLASIIGTFAANAQQQYGFSKAYIYNGDTMARSDQLFYNLLYVPNSGSFIAPFISMNENYFYLNQWRKINSDGLSVAEEVEHISDARRYFNHQTSYAWQRQDLFYAAGGYFQAGDSFYTMFLQMRDTNLNRIWVKEYPTTYTYIDVRSIIPLSATELLISPIFERNATMEPEYPYLRAHVNLIKLDTVGNQLWHKKIDSSEWTLVAQAIKAHDGNIMLCGITKGYGTPDNGAAWVMKVDTGGNKLWHKTYNLPGYDLLEKIVATTDGNYICVGGTSLPPAIQDMPRGGGRVLKIDEQGDIIWDTVINDNPRGGHFWTVVPTQNGDVVAFGTEYKYYAYDQYNYQVGSTREPDGWAVRLDSNGDIVWNRVFGHNAIPHAHEYLYNAIALPDGGFVAAGTTQVADTYWYQGNRTPYTRQAAWMVKLDSNGCVDAACSELTGLGTAAPEGGRQHISLYPNPGNGRATLRSSKAIPAGARLYITDMAGRAVQQQTIKDSTMQLPINIAGNASGLYLIRLQVGAEQYSIKYVLVHEK